MDKTRATDAVEAFRMLSRVASDSIETKPLPGGFVPRSRVDSSIKVLNLREGVTITSPPKPDDRDHQWLAHLFATVSDGPSHFWIGQPDCDPPLRLDVLLLPIDSFQASTVALDEAANPDCGGRGRPKKESTLAVEARTGESIANIRQIRSRMKPKT
jgi:hypothetical protein